MRRHPLMPVENEGRMRSAYPPADEQHQPLRIGCQHTRKVKQARRAYLRPKNRPGGGKGRTGAS